MCTKVIIILIFSTLACTVLSLLAYKFFLFVKQQIEISATTKYRRDKPNTVYVTGNTYSRLLAKLLVLGLIDKEELVTYDTVYTKIRNTDTILYTPRLQQELEKAISEYNAESYLPKKEGD